MIRSKKYPKIITPDVQARLEWLEARFQPAHTIGCEATFYDLTFDYDLLERMRKAHENTYNFINDHIGSRVSDLAEKFRENRFLNKLMDVDSCGHIDGDVLEINTPPCESWQMLARMYAELTTIANRHGFEQSHPDYIGGGGGHIHLGGSKGQHYFDSISERGAVGYYDDGHQKFMEIEVLHALNLSRFFISHPELCWVFNDPDDCTTATLLGGCFRDRAAWPDTVRHFVCRNKLTFPDVQKFSKYERLPIPDTSKSYAATSNSAGSQQYDDVNTVEFRIFGSHKTVLDFLDCAVFADRLSFYLKTEFTDQGIVYPIINHDPKSSRKYSTFAFSKENPKRYIRSFKSVINELGLPFDHYSRFLDNFWERIADPDPQTLT